MNAHRPHEFRWPAPPPREVPDGLAYSTLAIIIMALLTVFA